MVCVADKYFGGMHCGYDENIGSFLYLSRIIVFFPFYYTGYCLDIKKLQEVLNKTWIKCLSAIFLTDMILYTLAKIEDNYSYIRLLREEMLTRLLM